MNLRKAMKRRRYKPAPRPAPRPVARKPGMPAPQPAGEKPGGAMKHLEGASFLAVTLLMVLALYATALLFLRPGSPGRALTLDQVVDAASAGRIKEATFRDEDARIVGLLRIRGGATERFWTSYPRSDAATNDLLKTFLSANTRVGVDSQPAKSLVRFLAQFLFPLVILANLFALLFALTKRGQGSGAADFLTFGKLADKRLANKEKSQATFKDVAAAEEAIIELSEVRDYLANPKDFEHMGAFPPKGVLLVGPPGCGKTLLARAVAGEAKANFLSISGSEFVESLVGVGAARVRDLFRQARTSTPSIIFIDELDAVGRQRGAGLGGGHDEREQTLNELLVQIDGFSPTEGVVVMAATNRADILDPALLRAGRFDRHISVERPDLEGRVSILKLHARKRRLADAQNDLPYIARHTAGFTGADLANLLNEGALLAVREKAQRVTRQHLEEAVERVLSGPRKKSKIISPEEKRRIAYHEAGHALAAAALGKSEAINKVSIIARGRGIGHLAVLHEDKSILTRGEMESQITVAMAGVAAEELVFDEPSTGAEQDLERATNTARDMAGRFGMTSALGRARVLHQQGEVFLGRDYLQAKDVSQPTLEDLDREVRRILLEEEAKATEILSTQRESLDEMANALIQQETLTGTALETLLRRIHPYHLKDSKAATNGRGRARRSVKAEAGDQS